MHGYCIWNSPKLICMSIIYEALKGGGAMFPCSLEIKTNVPLFPESNFPIYFSMFPKIYVLEQMFPCSLEVNGLVPQNPWETLIYHAFITSASLTAYSIDTIKWLLLFNRIRFFYYDMFKAAIYNVFQFSWTQHKMNIIVKYKYCC